MRRVRASGFVRGFTAASVLLCMGCFKKTVPETDTDSDAGHGEGECDRFDEPQDGGCSACGNSKIELGEECEIGARSDGNDGMSAGDVYDEWSCDARTCKRRFDFTPCRNSSHCGGRRCDNGRCDTTVTCEWERHSGERPCEIASRHEGLCIAQDNCVPVCDSSSCPPNSPCVTIGAYRLCDTEGATAAGR